jgi:hypothetical protein
MARASGSRPFLAPSRADLDVPLPCSTAMAYSGFRGKRGPSHAPPPCQVCQAPCSDDVMRSWARCRRRAKIGWPAWRFPVRGDPDDGSRIWMLQLGMAVPIGAGTPAKIAVKRRLCGHCGVSSKLWRLELHLLADVRPSVPSSRLRATKVLCSVILLLTSTNYCQVICAAVLHKPFLRRPSCVWSQPQPSPTVRLHLGSNQPFAHHRHRPGCAPFQRGPREERP